MSGKRKKNPSEGLLGAFAELIPGLGGLVKKLEENPAFREKLLEADQGMQKNLSEVKTRKPATLDFHFSIRPLGSGLMRSATKWIPRTYKQLLRPPREGAVREPFFEVIKNKNTLRVVGVLPGLKGEAQAKVKGKKLVLTLEGKKKEIRLPFNAKLLKITYKNGVLEIILRIEKRGKKS